MTQLIPNRLLFDFEFPLAYRKTPPRIDGKLTGWSDNEVLPPLMTLEDASPFADVWSCWNDQGLYIACRIEGKRTPLKCDPKTYWKGDNLRFCVDMRDSRRNKRASRYCQQFFFMPLGGGKSGGEAVGGSVKIHRAREHAPLFASESLLSVAGMSKDYARSGPVKRGVGQDSASTGSVKRGAGQEHFAGVGQGYSAGVGQEHLSAGSIVRVAADVSQKKYSLEAHIPTDCLAGFDPDQHPRIGFYYMLEDRDHGQQYLTVGDDLNWHIDPSMWPTAVLAR